MEFARVDATKCHDVAAELGVEELPSLVVYRKRRARLYSGPHTSVLSTLLVVVISS